MEAERLTNLNVATTPMASSKIEMPNESNNEKTEADADAVFLNAMDDNRRFFKMHTGDLAPDVHILVLILDIDYGQSYIQSGKVDMALNMVDAAMVLANGHLLQRPRNEVGVIACSRNIVMLVHSIDIPLTSYDYQLDTIKTMEYDVSRKVEEELLREFEIVEKLSEEDKSSLIAESLSLALTYIQKRRRQIPDIYTGRRVQGRILHPSYDNLILDSLETNVTMNVCAIKVEKLKPLQPPPKSPTASTSAPTRRSVCPAAWSTTICIPATWSRRPSPTSRRPPAVPVTASTTRLDSCAPSAIWRGQSAHGHWRD